MDLKNTVIKFPGILFMLKNEYLIIILIIGFLLRLNNFTLGIDNIGSDETVTLMISLWLLDPYHSLSETGHEMNFYYAPLVPIIYAFLFIPFFIVKLLISGFIIDTFKEDLFNNLSQLIIFLRFFNVLVSTLILFVFYKLIKLISNKQIALIGMILLSFSSIHIEIAKTIRFWNFFMLFFLLAIYFSFKLLYSDNIKNLYLAFLFMSLNFGSMYHGIIVLYPITVLCFFLKKRTRNEKKHFFYVNILLMFFMVLIYVLHPFAFERGLHIRSYLVNVHAHLSLYEKITFYPLSILSNYGLFITLFITIGIILTFIKGNKEIYLLLISIILYYLLLIFIANTFEERHFIPALTLLLFFCAYGLYCSYQELIKLVKYFYMSKTALD